MTNRSQKSGVRGQAYACRPVARRRLWAAGRRTSARLPPCGPEPSGGGGGGVGGGWEGSGPAPYANIVMAGGFVRPDFTPCGLGGGGGGTSAPWGKALARLSGASFLLQGLNPSPACQKDLDAICAKTGITLSAIQAEDRVDSWNNAAVSNQPAQGLFSPSDPDYSKIANMGITILQYVSWPTVTVAAEPGSVLAGNIYFNPSYVLSMSGGYDAALLLHETSHLLGATDPQLEAALGCSGASECITDKLATDCFGVTKSGPRWDSVDRW